MWVSDQQKVKNAGKLVITFERHLDKLGIVWDVLDNQWEWMFALFVQFKDWKGHCNVPYCHNKEGMHQKKATNSKECRQA